MKVSAVLLAGGMRLSPLREALDLHVLCLPVGSSGTLLDRWIGVLSGIEGLNEAKVVVNTSEDVDAVNAMAMNGRERVAVSVRPTILAEPGRWRGAAGILRDVVGARPNDDLIIVCETKRLPPRTLKPLLQTWTESDTELAGVVGVCGDDEPAGAYAFSAHAISRIPAVGYFDMKEQFLPALSRNGERVATAKVGSEVWPMRDRESYLAAVRASLNGFTGQHAAARISDQASVSPSAVIDGCCIIESGVVVEDGAVVHESVVLWGAKVGGGAVVSQSVIGPHARVNPRGRIIRQIVAGADQSGGWQMKFRPAAAVRKARTRSRKRSGG